MFTPRMIRKTFLKVVDERYPSGEKILQIISNCFESNSEIALVKTKIILVNLIRDMIKEASPTYVFRSQQHRDDLYAAVIEASEELEDQLVDLESGQMVEEEEEV